MDISWYKQFEETIHDEIEGLFAQLFAKKQHIWDLVSKYLEDEAEFQGFLDQYETFFQRHHFHIAQLSREEASLRRRLQAKEDREGIIDFGELFGKTKQDEQELIPEEELSYNSTEDQVTFLEDFGNTGDAIENDSVQIEKVRESIKKQVAHSFLWIYHPRRTNETGDQFLTKRSRLITELMNSPLYDAIEIMLRIPFEARDRELWKAQIPKLGSESGMESAGDSWYRYKLWDTILDVALPKAQAIAVTPPHDLYPHFQEMKLRGIRALFFFQELEIEKNREIEDLEIKIAHLRRNTDQRGSK